MKIIYLTTDEIVEIHNKIIEETGGHSGVLSLGNLDFLVSQSEIPKDLYRAIEILFYGILTGHPFVDGNKRTAFECLDVFLRLNGKSLIATKEDLWKALHEISEGKLDAEKSIAWLKKNSK